MGNSNQLKISSHTIHKLNTAHSTNHMQAHLIRAKWNKTLCHIFHCHCVVCVASVNYYLCGHCHHHHQHKNHNCTVAPSHSQNRITTFLFAFFFCLLFVVFVAHHLNYAYSRFIYGSFRNGQFFHPIFHLIFHPISHPRIVYTYKTAPFKSIFIIYANVSKLLIHATNME